MREFRRTPISEEEIDKKELYGWTKEGRRASRLNLKFNNGRRNSSSMLSDIVTSVESSQPELPSPQHNYTNFMFGSQSQEKID